MPKYSYKARERKTGKVISNTIEAQNQAEAVKKLREKGFLILKIGQDKSVNINLPILGKVSSKDRILFAKELAVMIKSGLPIIQALKAIEEQTTSKTLQASLTSMIEEIEGGTSLSEAISHYPRAFPPIFASVTKTGEKSGKLEEVLNRLAIQLEKDDDLVSRIKGAMIYPVFVLIALVAVLTLIMVYIIPQLRTIFEDAGVQLPLITRIMLAISGVMEKYFIIVLSVTTVAMIALKISMRNAGMKLFMENIRFKLPVFGKLQRQVLMTRFTNTLSTLLAAGLPMIEAIRTTGEVMNSPTYTIALAAVTKQIESGGSLSQALLHDKRFPVMIGHMAAIGENSGNIDTVLDTVASFYDKEVENMTRNLSATLEPLLMLVMGVAVGIVIASVIVPIYGLVDAV